LVSKDLVERLGFSRLPTEIIGRSVSDLMDLRGRVAFVTGGGGVVHAQWGATARPITCDVTDWDSVTAAMASCAEDLGRIDILVNNVGGGGPVGYFETNTIDAIDAGVRINLVTQIYCTKAVLDHMIPRRSGAIINIASDGGKSGMPGIVVYNACKAAVIGFTKNLAFEISQYGIRVNCVCPGIMLSQPLVDALGAMPADDPMLSPFEFSMARVPVGRGCLPEEVANAVVFLAGDAASYVQGAAYSVGGGLEL
jgi:3-oxoacyl-[acyl-carrier protein] reductase